MFGDKKYVQMRRMYLQIITAPEYILCEAGDFVARAPRTGMMYIVRRSGRSLACANLSVDVFDIDTVVREIDGRPSAVGVRGARIGAGQV